MDMRTTLLTATLALSLPLAAIADESGGPSILTVRPAEVGDAPDRAGRSAIPINRGPEVTPPSSARSSFEDWDPRRPVDSAMIDRGVPEPRRTPQATLSFGEDRYVYLPYGWYGYPYDHRPKRRGAGFSVVLKDDNFYLRLGDPPRRYDRYPRPYPHPHDKAGPRAEGAIAPLRR